MLSYLQKGEGRDLVMLHGYLSSKESFYPQIDYFSKQYRVTALDFPGMGMADALTEPYSVGDYAAWTERALQDLGISRPLLLAHSFGGRVAIKLLAAGRAEAAVLVGCAGIVPKRGAGYRMKVGLFRAVKKIAPSFAERHFGSADYRALSPVMRESFKKIVNEDLRKEAALICRPVLFVVGERDGETPPASAGILHRAVEGSRLEIMAGCGHFAHLDDPITFQLLAEEFFYEL